MELLKAAALRGAAMLAWLSRTIVSSIAKLQGGDRHGEDDLRCLRTHRAQWRTTRHGLGFRLSPSTQTRMGRSCAISTRRTRT
eukprot:3729128-Pyramimonas_sp.AAC.1